MIAALCVGRITSPNNTQKQICLHHTNILLTQYSGIFNTVQRDRYIYLERKRERDRETETETERQRQRETEIEIETERETEIETEIETERDRERDRERQRETERDRERDRDRDRDRERQRKKIRYRIKPPNLPQKYFTAMFSLLTCLFSSEKTKIIYDGKFVRSDFEK